MSKLKLVQNTLRLVKKAPGTNNFAYRIAQTYIDEYRDFSYDAATNGEQEIVKKVSTIFKDGFTFIDAGANVGEWTTFVCSQLNSCVGHLFELSAETFKTLKKNLENRENLTLVNKGLSDQNTQIEYKYYGKNDGGNTIVMGASYHKKPYEVLSADVVTGDYYCQKNKIKHINFLKVDTEGAEYAVLKGFENNLKQQTIDIVQFEYGYTHADAKTLMRDFFELFESHGYIVGRLTGTGVSFKNFEYTDNDFKSGPNYVACLPQYKATLETF